MKTTVALTLLLLCIQTTLSCQSCSDCCQTTSDCCQTSTSCCQTCQIRCRTSSCVDTCKSDCCTPKKCPDLPVEADTPRDNCPDKDTATEPADDKTNVPSEGVKNVNKNNINFTATINLTNVVNNENRVYVPINITNYNANSVIITSSLGGVVTKPPDSSTSPTPHTVVVTVKVPILIPVPGKNVTIYRPLPYPVPFPVLIPVRGCCVTVTPCVTDYCNPFGRTCGDDCTDRFMYRPVNPCENGCFRRFAAWRRDCYGSGYCRNDYVDCSYCNENFYTSYDGYQQCGGCFYPY